MTTPREEDARAINALAFVMHRVRPEWDVPGCVAALRKCAETVRFDHLAIAAIRYCADERNLTPAHLADFGNWAWESQSYPPCKNHPGYFGRRTDGECGLCFADRHAATEYEIPRRHGKPIPDEARQQIVAAIGGAR